jgi:hypothetical protein
MSHSDSKSVMMSGSTRFKKISLILANSRNLKGSIFIKLIRNETKLYTVFFC